MRIITVCIVEDLDEVREGLENFINSDPEFVVIKALSNAEDAMILLPEIQPDIVIMDINLPGMCGIDCIRAVKEKCMEAQFMMFTVYENDEKVFDALKAGASGYLLKKTPPAKIIEALKELFNGGSPMSSNIARKLVTSFYSRENKVSILSQLLSPRENEILEFLSKGLLYKEISEKLSIATGTVRQHIHKMYMKNFMFKTGRKR